MNGVLDTDIADVLTVPGDNSKTRDHSTKLGTPQCAIDASKYHFLNRVVNVWNSLPNGVVSESLAMSACKRYLLQL